MVAGVGDQRGTALAAADHHNPQSETSEVNGGDQASRTFTHDQAGCNAIGHDCQPSLRICIRNLGPPGATEQATIDCTRCSGTDRTFLRLYLHFSTPVTHFQVNTE